MAGGKLSPRQKMIGMMYLVLTALLALNVSKEILDAFVTINAGLENTGQGFDQDLAALYARFDEKKSVDPLRVTANWEKAQEAKRMSKEVNQYIDLLKKRLIRETEGFANHEEDTARLMYVNGKDNYDVPTDIMIGQSEDGSSGEARILKTKLTEYKASLLALLPENTAKQLHLPIDTQDPQDGGETRTWEMRNFYHSPLAASVTILSKIQDDVKSAEADVVDELLKATDSDIIPFDTVAARVIAPTSYVLLGEEYNADIFLAAFNKTLVPQVLIGEYDTATGKMIGAYDSLPVFNGLGQYRMVADREGIMTYEGVINMKTPKGTYMQFPFQSQYIVARPSANVSADSMNVMYGGLENPITVSVPGIPNEKVRVTCDNGTLIPKGNGKYVVRNPAVGKCRITISAETDSGTVKPMGVSMFRVKRLPKPYASVSGASGGKATKAQMMASPGLLCVYENFEFPAKPKVTKFRVEVVRNGIVDQTPMIGGNLFNQQCRDKFAGLQRGNKVIITDIEAMGPDGIPVKLEPLVVTIQ
jgi:gliding motility-associated protein GldM